MLRSADFNAGTSEAFLADSGVFSATGGKLSVTAASTSGDAAAVYYIDQYLPIYYEIHAQVYLTKPTGGWKANAYVIFDYFAPTDFKFAGVDQSTNKLVMGRRTTAGLDRRRAGFRLRRGEVQQVVHDARGGERHDRHASSSTASPPSPTPSRRGWWTAWPYGLNKGFVGVGSNQSRGSFDNISVKVLPPAITLDVTETFDSGAGLVSDVRSGTWTASEGKLTGSVTAGAQPAVALAALERLEANAFLEITATLTLAAGARAGVVYDFYSDTEYKFITLDVAAQAITFGHVSEGSRVADLTVPWALNAATAYTLLVTIKGASVSLVLNGAFVRSMAYNSALADGYLGLIVGAGSASADSFRVRTDSANAALRVVASTAAATSGITATSEPVPVPVSEPVPAPVPAPTPEPAPDPDPDPAPIPAPAPAPEPAPEPAPAPSPPRPRSPPLLPRRVTAGSRRTRTCGSAPVPR